jgi:hypothetical protein
MEQNEQADGEPITLTLDWQADLLVVLTTLPLALDGLSGSTTDWRNHDVIQLYENLALTTCRILLNDNHSFVLQHPEQLDALVDRIALLFLQQGNTTTPNALLGALVACVNCHINHVQHVSHEHPVLLFPLLHSLETIQLLQIVVPRCIQYTSCRWDPAHSNDCLGMWSFCQSLLQHLAMLKEDCDVHGWLQRQCLANQDSKARYTSPQLLQQHVDDFLEHCRSFGVELIEYALEILDQATIEDSATEHASDAIRHASLAFTTAQVLRQGLDIPVSFSMLRSLFVAYSSFVAILTHKHTEQDGTKAVACGVLTEMALFVLQHPQSRSVGDNDPPLETAVSITLLCALDSNGIQQDMAPILEYMRGRVNVEPPAHKKPRRGVSGPFTDIIQSSIMASLMLATAGSSVNDSVARLVQSCSPDSDPWHPLIARKVAESFGIDPKQSFRYGDKEETSNLSWSDRILRKYVSDHQKPPIHESQVDTRCNTAFAE